MTENQNQIKVVLPDPYPAQLKVLKACLNAYTKYIVVNGSRQVGKTALSIMVALKWAMDEHKQHVMIVSPTDSQVKKIYNQMNRMIGGLPILTHKKSQSGDSEMVFKNGSVILFRSAASKDSLRGYSNTHLICDEVAFMEEETYQAILAPSLSALGKKVLFTSTPRGKNFFYKLFMKGKEDMNVYKSFKLLYKDNPYCNQEFVEQQRLSLPKEMFDQEYLGEFVDGASVFKNIDEIANLTIVDKPTKGEIYFMGVDIAFKIDYTVITVLNNKAEMVYYKRFNKKEAPEIRSEIKSVYDFFKPRRCLIELNNQGLPLYEDLRREGLWNIEGFLTSTESKPRIINNLINACANKEIRLIKDDVIKEEFKAFGYEVSQTGQVKFRSAYGHDDIVMSVAIAFECYNKNKWSGAGYTFR